MKFVNKQAICQTMTADMDYISPEMCQIRAFTVCNPMAENVDCRIAVNGKIFVKKTITAHATEVMSALFNQQLGKGERLSITGNGLNVWVSVVEIVD